MFKHRRRLLQEKSGDSHDEHIGESAFIRFDKQVYLMPLTVVSVGHLLVDMYLGGFPVLFPILQEICALYAQIGLLVFLVQFSSSVLQPIFGWLSDRWQVRSILQLSLALAAGGLALIVFAPNYMVVLFGTLICGLGVAAYHPEASKLALFAGGRRRAMAMSAFSRGQPRFVTGARHHDGRLGGGGHARRNTAHRCPHLRTDYIGPAVGHSPSAGQRLFRNTDCEAVICRLGRGVRKSCRRSRREQCP